jgi:hypothetical protein
MKGITVEMVMGAVGELWVKEEAVEEEPDVDPRTYQ